MNSGNFIHYSVLFFMLIYAVTANLPEGASCLADGYPGTCLLWKKCYNLVLGIRKREYPPLCSYDGLEPIICCTSCNRTEDITKIVLSRKGGVLKKTDQISWNRCIDYSLQLPYEKIMQSFLFHYNWRYYEWRYDLQCSKFLSETRTFFSVGGRSARRSEFPHMALLGYGKTIKTSQWLCGGSLLNDKFILTAAHCISTPTFIQFNKNVLPACLPNLEEPVHEEKATATGWGMTGAGTPLADNLQAVEVTRFSHDVCSSLFKEHRHFQQGFNHDTQMCFGDLFEVRNTCEGDSGGPLQIFGQAYKYQRTIIGVTSYGPQCNTLGKAGVYTQVRPYVPWIDSIIWSY